MKNIFKVALLALFGAAAVSCTNDFDQTVTPETPEQEMTTVYFTTGKDATRTTLDKNLNVLWSDSDQLRVLYGDSYTIADPAIITENNGTDATFKFTLPVGSEDKAIYVAYPYWAGGYTGFNGELYGVPIAATQPMVNGGFADNVNTSVCKLNWTGSEYTGRMVNVGGIIAVKVTGDVNITKAVLTSADGKVMAGTGTAYYISESGCSWDGHYSSSNPTAITLNATTALNCAEGVELMFVACANDFSGGFSLAITSDTNKTVQYDLAGGELARARILDLAPVTLNPTDYAGKVINLRGTYKTKKIASKWPRADAKYSMGTTIMTAEDTGFIPANNATNPDANSVAPKDGQKYAVVYEKNPWNDNMVLYFDVASEPNANGMYDLINLQDRAGKAGAASVQGGGYDPITHNASYYDPNTGNIYFDFIRKGIGSPGNGASLEMEGDEVGYGYSWVFYTGTMPSHKIVTTTYNITFPTSKFNAYNRYSSGHIGKVIYDVNTDAEFGSPKDSQEFKMDYLYGMDIYFDLSLRKNSEGNYDIINLIDREAGTDKISQNASYYNPTTGEVYIDFVIEANNAPGCNGGDALEDTDYTVAGYAFCALLTPAE